MAMTNTQIRLASAGIMIILVFFSLYMGRSVTFFFLLLGALLSYDEIKINFFKKRRNSADYILGLFLLLLACLGLYGFQIPESYILLPILLGCFFNFFLFFYLFATKMDHLLLHQIEKRVRVLSLGFIFLPVSSLIYLLKHESWIFLILFLFIMNFVTDSGAWLFGKHFGKRKLWPSVSPKKTLEGLIGGVCLSGVLSTGIYLSVMKMEFGVQNILFYLFLFGLLAFIGHCGDFVQSKFKRQSQIKDSSGLIPGHGGVYDRVDSLLFVVPFFCAALFFQLF